jgi:hypothetical protein
MDNFNKRGRCTPQVIMKILHFALFLACGPLFSGSRHPIALTGSAGFSGGGRLSDSTGIEGIAYTVSGNRMPSPDLPPVPRPLRGVRATICVFELTHSSQVVPSGQSACYTSVNTKPVRQADTDDKGHFAILLAPGRYSVFTKKGGLFCAGRRDDKNNIAPVDVVAGKMTTVECRVETDHKAIY